MHASRPVVPALIAAVLGLAVLAPAAGALQGLDPFRTPSGHIACMYQHFSGQKAELRCDVDHVAHPAKRPASCDLDYGGAFGLGQSGRAQRLCVGDTVRDPKAKVLAYGRTRTLGPFTCTSRTSGLTCKSRSGHGFVLSREHQKLF